LPAKSELPVFPLEEKEIVRRNRRSGGVDWIGEQAGWWDGGVDIFEKAGSESGESFDLMAGAEAESSVLLEGLRDDFENEAVEGRRREGAEEYATGTDVFGKM
jgi:D-arabinono-1,4-lactone oxidase